ncbi:hypothetical protein CR513_23050, partial [Mucuna pruriens]
MPSVLDGMAKRTRTRDIQSVNAKVEALSRGREENRQPSMQESEARHEEDHVSGSSRSHRNQRHGHYKRVKRHGRNRMERNELRRDDLESVKCKFPLFFVWWYHMMYDMRRMRRSPCDIWAELKERFVPSYYARDPYVKLQSLYQGSKSVEEYYKEMENCMMRA